MYLSLVWADIYVDVLLDLLKTFGSNIHFKYFEVAQENWDKVNILYKIVQTAITG